MPSCNAFIRTRTLSLVVACSLSASGFAAEFTTSAAVAPGLAYTDNVCLSDENKQDSWVGIMTPSGAIQGKGRKADFSVGGSVQFNTLTDSQLEDDNCGGGSAGDREQFAPNVDARGSAILIDDWLNFNATGRANQNEANSFVGGGDSFNGNGNTNTYYRYSLNPVLSRRLKNFATYNLRYNYDEVINTEDTVSDSSSDSWSTNLQSSSSNQISWNLFGDYRVVSYSGDDLFFNPNDGSVQPREDSELKQAGLTLGYQINREWQVNATSGYEWNDYQTSIDEDTSGITWDTGVRWTPSARTTVSTGIGSRYFGQTPRLNITHRRKRSSFSASYNKSISFGRDILTQGNDFNSNVSNFSSTNSEGPIIDERFTLGYTYSGRRANMGLIGSHSNQTEEDTGRESTFDDLGFNYSPLVPPPYSLSGSISWRNSDSDSTFFDPDGDNLDYSEAWSTGVTLGRILNERMSLSLDYRYTDQQSEDSFNEYQENRVMATLNIRL